jgi:hypothetical protein
MNERAVVGAGAKGSAWPFRGGGMKNLPAVPGLTGKPYRT